MRRIKSKISYPVSIKEIQSNVKSVKEYFATAKPHKDGVFIDIFLLEGAFMWVSSGDLFQSLTHNEKLALVPDNNYTFACPPLMATRNDGTVIGKIPHANTVLPYYLMEKGLSLWCYIESMDFNGGMPEIAVSLYCEKY